MSKELQRFHQELQIWSIGGGSDGKVKGPRVSEFKSSVTAVFLNLRSRRKYEAENNCNQGQLLGLTV